MKSELVKYFTNEHYQAVEGPLKAHIVMSKFYQSLRHFQNKIYLLQFKSIINQRVKELYIFDNIYLFLR